MSSVVADIFRQAALLNKEDPRTEGSVVCLGAACDVIVTGDIHGHRANLAKVIAHAGVAADQRRRLVLQEIIHSPTDAGAGRERSVACLLRAARLKVAHPSQVLFVFGNHDAAQITGNEIVKDGLRFCRMFEAGVDFAFGAQGSDVLAAVKEFLFSLPLAVRCPNGVLITHSLPSPRRMEIAGTEILRRPFRMDDLQRGGAVYEWTWGRGHTDEQLDQLAEQLGVTFFVLGHQHLETGCQMVGRRAVALASDHNHGCILSFSADTPLTAETLPRSIRKIASLGGDS